MKNDHGVVALECGRLLPPKDSSKFLRGLLCSSARVAVSLFLFLFLHYIYLFFDTEALPNAEATTTNTNKAREHRSMIQPIKIECKK